MTDPGQPDEALVLTAIQDQLAQARLDGDERAEQELLLRLAQEWWRLQRHEEAMRAYCEVYVLTLRTRDEAALLSAELGLGRYYLQKVQVKQAEFLFEFGLELAREQKNQEAEVECLYSLSQTAILCGDPHSALLYAEQARDIFRARADRVGEATVGTILAAAHTNPHSKVSH